MEHRRKGILLSEDQVWMCLACSLSALAFGILVTFVANTHRHKSLRNLFGVTTTSLVGSVILAATLGNDWHVSRANITAQYAAFSPRLIRGDIGVHIGLQTVNITLRGVVPDLARPEVSVNEEFSWTEGGLGSGLRSGLRKGLPYPVLTAAEYLTIDTPGYGWGRSYSQAGQYASFFLWCALILWVMSGILFPVERRAAAVCLSLTGLLLLLTTTVYSYNLPHHALEIPYSSQRLAFTYGWCYYVTLMTGFFCLAIGSLMWSSQPQRPPTDDGYSSYPYHLIPDSQKDCNQNSRSSAYEKHHHHHHLESQPSLRPRNVPVVRSYLDCVS